MNKGCKFFKICKYTLSCKFCYGNKKEMPMELFILKTKMRMTQDMILRYKHIEPRRVCPYELCSGLGEEKEYHGLWCIFYGGPGTICEDDNEKGLKKLENMYAALGRERWEKFDLKY